MNLTKPVSTTVDNVPCPGFALDVDEDASAGIQKLHHDYGRQVFWLIFEGIVVLGNGFGVDFDGSNVFLIDWVFAAAGYVDLINVRRAQGVASLGVRVFHGLRNILPRIRLRHPVVNSVEFEKYTGLALHITVIVLLCAWAQVGQLHSALLAGQGNVILPAVNDAGISGRLSAIIVWRKKIVQIGNVIVGGICIVSYFFHPD